jgi:choline dehydrogenase
VGCAILSRRFSWGLMTEPQAALDNRRIFLPRGKLVGGSGSINGMAYHRGHPRDYDDWAAAGNAGWGWNDVLPYFRRSENNADFRDPAVHGVDGPVHVQHIPKPNPLNQDFARAFEILGGYSQRADFTGAEREGYGLRQGTIFHGRRDSTATAYLHPALRRPNLTVLTRAARRIRRSEASVAALTLAGEPMPHHRSPDRHYL